MGRKKIPITRLTDERNRQITFSKRKAGLLKKAYELSILCDVEIAVIMITSNSKLYQYASSNMNSILIRYTDFKDPDENKTNADILDDITKKVRGGGGQEDSGEDEPSTQIQQSFMLTPRTQENFRRIDKEFDHLLQTNQVPPPASAPVSTLTTPMGSAPPIIPNVMPVRVPVGYSPSTIQQQIQQHLQNQIDSQKSSSSSSGLNSASAAASMISPQSDLSSGSPMAVGRGHRSPTNMPPPLNTPTRLQTLRNQTLKLHLPGSGRNYISLPTGGEGESSKKNDAGSGDEVEDGRNNGEGGARPATKPQLRVYIPGQKEFIPRTQDNSPLPQVNLTTQPAGVGGVSVADNSSNSLSVSAAITTTTESLTTPVFSLTTPNILSSLPPIFSSLLGEFPFGQMSSSATPAVSGAVGGAEGGGGGGNDNSSAALVAFPVSIQPSATSGTGAGNLILQAQNMGQPFLLTPTYDSRQNPLFNSQGYTPPTSGLTAALGPNIGGIQNIEQLKQQYERTQQMIQQQLLYTQMQMLQQQQQSKEGSGGSAVEAMTVSGTSVSSTTGDADSRLKSQGSEGRTLPQYINGSDVMISSHAQQTQTPSHSMGRTRQVEKEDNSPPADKKVRLDSSPDPVE